MYAYALLLTYYALVVEDLSGADVVYTIGADGEVQRAANVNQFVKEAFAKLSEKDRERQPPPPTESSHILPSNLPPVPEMQRLGERHDDETVRQRGDLSLYRYYLRNMGWGRLGVFFVLTVMTAIFNRLPRKYYVALMLMGH